jgi:hypothetical protein
MRKYTIIAICLLVSVNFSAAKSLLQYSPAERDEYIGKLKNKVAEERKNDTRSFGGVIFFLGLQLTYMYQPKIFFGMDNLFMYEDSPGMSRIGTTMMVIPLFYGMIFQKSKKLSTEEWKTAVTDS